MKKKENEIISEMNSSRRRFIRNVGTAAAGLLVVPYLKPSGVFAYNHKRTSSYLATVAITNTNPKSGPTPADSYVYDDASGGVKQKVQYLFDQLGGISDLFSAGKKVVIKINLTGGSGYVGNSMLKGVPITEAMWSHPVVVQAVAQLIIDAGVTASDITIVDSLGSGDSFSNSAFQGYVDVKNALGCGLVDISKGTFVNISTGSSYFNFPSLTMNQILRDTDVYVSVPKLKQHATAGLTCSLKNQVGATPQSSYELPGYTYRRERLHHQAGTDSEWNYLPETICDLNAARPVHLAVVDGIKNAKGGEGAWNPNFVPFQSHALLAGKDPVATDSIGANVMGLDCEAATLTLPGPLTDNGVSSTECDNYLYLLNNKGVGTNQLNEINIVGDGANLITSVRPNLDTTQPADFKLCANFPNPFNPSTIIVFYLPRNEHVTLKVFDVTGRAIETLVDGEVPAGEHRLQWSATGLASGIYLCRMETKDFAETIKMVYQK
ncbi:MAG TPA: DUF362 domain-containing protein [Candidatus Acidoferrales bacterium]|nr:DUF362 domain-containing protein [Candidatus Acidoferrales bacterium]